MMAYDFMDGLSYVDIEDRSDPKPTQDGHMVVRVGQVILEGKVWSTTWECVICGTGYTPGFRDRTEAGPPAKLRRDCQTALTTSVLES